MIATQQVIRTFFTAILACIFYFYASSPESYWIVLTALLLVQINPNNFFWQDITAVVICGALIANNAFWIHYLSQNYILLVCILFLIIFLCILIGLMYSELFVPATVVSLLTLVSLGKATDILVRIKFILLGCIIAALMKAVLWPPGLKRHLHLQFAKCLQALNQLQKYIFWIYIARNYADKHYLYEKELHFQRLNVLNSIENLRLLSKTAATKNLIQQFEKLFEITIAFGEMRYRVKDFSTFEMSENEFVAISNALANLLDQAANQILVANKQVLDFSAYNRSIEALEDLIQGTMQVAVAEPVVFVIFVHYLQMMSAELSVLVNTASEAS